MEVKIENVEGISVFSLPVTHIDAANYEEVQESLGRAIKGCTQAILDLRGMEFVDSSGIGVILFCIRQLESGGGKLRISDSNETIRSAFELVRIDRLAEICDTRFDAIAAFKGDEG